jgi:sugar phosphate isomerase/epimerase
MLLCANADLRYAKRLAELGYDAIDAGLYRVIYHDDPYPHNPLLDEPDFEKALDVHIKECKELGLCIPTTHLPYRFAYHDPSSKNYEYYHEMTCRSLRASEYLGAKWAVLHVHKPENTVAYVKRLFADSGVKDIGIAIENLLDFSIDELIDAHDRLANEGCRVGICLDTGHCNVNKFYDNDIYDVIKKLGARIKMLHVHDNMRNSDRHGAPYTGNIKWDKVMRGLAEIGFDGALNLELQPESIPEPARDAFEKYCVAIGRHLITVFEKAKK